MTRSRSAGGSCAWPRRSRSSTPSAGSTPRCTSRSGAAAAGSTRSWSSILKRTRADAAFWASLPAGELEPWEPRERRLTADESLPGPDRGRVRGRRGREVAVDLPPLRPHVRDRDEHRGAARLRRPRARRHAPGGAAARRRQARDLQPDPRQARAADRRGVRGRPPPSAPHDRDPGADARLLRPRPGGGRPPRAARRLGLPARARRRRADACRCACSPSPTSTRR